MTLRRYNLICDTLRVFSMIDTCCTAGRSFRSEPRNFIRFTSYLRFPSDMVADEGSTIARWNNQGHSHQRGSSNNLFVHVLSTFYSDRRHTNDYVWKNASPDPLPDLLP